MPQIMGSNLPAAARSAGVAPVSRLLMVISFPAGGRAQAAVVYGDDRDRAVFLARVPATYRPHTGLG